MRQIRGVCGNQYGRTLLRKMLTLLLLGSVPLLALPLTLSAAQYNAVPLQGDDNLSPETTALLQKAMIDTAENNPRRLFRYQERIAEVFCEAAESGLEAELIEAFTKMWTSLRKSDQDTNPQFAGLPEVEQHKIYSCVLYILDQYISKLQEIEANSDRSPKLFDALQSLVLPPDEEQVVVLGWYKRGGGKNGFYRTFAEYLVERAIAEDRLDDLAAAVKQRREKIAAKLAANLTANQATELAAKLKGTDSKKLTNQEKASLTESVLKCDLIEMLAAIKQRDLKQIATLKKRFSDAIKKNELPKAQAAHWATLSLVPAYDDAELFTQVDDLLQEATSSLEKAKRLPRYYNFLMPRILPTALEDSNLDRVAMLAHVYRKFHRAQPYASKSPDHLQFATDNKLYAKALATDSPAELLAVVNYFCELRTKHARRPKLLPLLDRLESLTSDLSKQDRESLLGDVNLVSIRKAETSRKIPATRKPLKANDAGLPKLPSGKLFFSDDFNESVNPAWSDDRRDISPNRKAIFLGGFTQDKLQLLLSDLPPHKLVRVQFELITSGGTDGLMGYSPNDKENSFGPDYWELYTGDQLRLIATTFSNFKRDPFDQKQSYPDDFPVAFGFKPAWHDRFMRTGKSLWNDDLEIGYKRGRAGAVADGSLGLNRSATYAMDLLFPHDSKSLELNFRSTCRDGSYSKDELLVKVGENWAMDNVRIELIDQFSDAKPEELTQCLDAISGDDPVAANAARWRLVAAGDKAVESLEQFSQTDKGKKLSTDPESFVRFRIERLLEIIGTENAKKLRKKWFGPNLTWDRENPKETIPRDFWQPDAA